MSGASADRSRGRDEQKDLPGASPRLEAILFALACLVYLASRLAGLTRYPAFFFGDEAVQGNLADQLLHNGFRDQTGTLLPPYFLNDQRWAISLSVYIHLVPVWLFGKTVQTIRATSVFVTLCGAIGTSLALRVGLRNRFWWVAPLVLAVEPVFFVHARLGFETAMMASFFGCFLWAYFLYRYRSPRYVFLALLFGAATFYAYTGGQGVMLVTGTLLFFSDLAYHLRQRWTLWLAAAVFALLLAFPYVRYRRLHPGVVRQQLVVLDSYWTHPIPLSAKLQQFGKTYLKGLDPRYWFWPNEKELARHRMKGMGFFPLSYLPLVALGLGVCAWNFPRSSAHRALLFSPLGVPFSAAAANLQILRLMAMVVPVTLLVVVAIDQLYRWVRRFLPYPPAAIALAGGFTVATGVLTARALADGPTWFPEYGLYGLQYGAPQVFGAIREELRRSPDTEILVSSTWANNPVEFVLFFLNSQERQRARLADIHAYDARNIPLSGHELFVMTPEEYALARKNKKFVLASPQRVLPYPDGRPGFYFVRLSYAPDADAVFRSEVEARARLLSDSVQLDGETVDVRHSRLDMGNLANLFDKNPDTLIRGDEVNPLVLVFRFPRPREISKVSLTLGAMDRVELTLLATPPGGASPKRYSASFANRPALPSLDYSLPDGPARVETLRLEIKEANAEFSHIEVRELSLR